MVLYDFSQAFRFTFRTSGQANGHLLAEVTISELTGNDLSVAPDAYCSSWFGTVEELRPMLSGLGFSNFDVSGIMVALHSGQDCDRQINVTSDHLHAMGFHFNAETLA